jgi:tRNA1Val (adenine37-N6)-methyltransferase
MANSWFQFKQFTIHQQHAAMKVTTDSCLFGALQPHFQPSDSIKMLDIGAGTGLVSLMVAQYNPGANITAVEIDTATAAEALENIARSPFSRNIKVVNKDIVNFLPDEKYHHIICNPPFYENQLSSPSKQKNIAHHAESLTMEILVPLIKKWLTPTGTASLLIPFYRENEVIQLGILEKLFNTTIIRFKQTPAHTPFRSILIFSQKKVEFCQAEITIRDKENQYTPEFKALLQPFYLNL